MPTPSQWEFFEANVLDPFMQVVKGRGRQVGTLTAVAVGEFLNVPTSEASNYIQSYLDAQRSKNSRTRYVIKRSGRTSKAVWTIGQRRADAEIRLSQFASDAVRTMERAVRPDLARMAVINPRLSRLVEKSVGKALDGLELTLEAIVEAALGGGA